MGDGNIRCSFSAIADHIYRISPPADQLTADDIVPIKTLFSLNVFEQAQLIDSLQSAHRKNGWSDQSFSHFFDIINHASKRNGNLSSFGRLSLALGDLDLSGCYPELATLRSSTEETILNHFMQGDYDLTRSDVNASVTEALMNVGSEWRGIQFGGDKGDFLWGEADQVMGNGGQYNRIHFRTLRGECPDFVGYGDGRSTMVVLDACIPGYLRSQRQRHRNAFNILYPQAPRIDTWIESASLAAIDIVSTHERSHLEEIYWLNMPKRVSVAMAVNNVDNPAVLKRWEPLGQFHCLMNELDADYMAIADIPSSDVMRTQAYVTLRLSEERTFNGCGRAWFSTINGLMRYRQSKGTPFDWRVFVSEFSKVHDFVADYREGLSLQIKNHVVEWLDKSTLASTETKVGKEQVINTAIARYMVENKNDPLASYIENKKSEFQTLVKRWGL